MTRLLVTGSRGQLGVDLVAEARRRGWSVDGLSRTDPGHPCDITDPAAVRDLVARVRPDVVVHAAAWTDVDGCELDPGRAHAINVAGTRHVADAAAEVGARTLLLSTDYVFDGDATEPYQEADPPRPRSVYGRTKAEAEEVVLARATGTVVRTSWLSGRHGRNIAKTVLARGLAGEPMRFVTDQVGNPTLAAGLAAAIADLVAEPLEGVVHVTHQGPASWFELAREVLDAAGLPTTLVAPIPTAQLDPPRPAPRPAYAVLGPGRLVAEGRAVLPDHRGPLAELVAELLAAGDPERW